MGEKDEMNEGGVWMKRVSGRGICGRAGEGGGGMAQQHFASGRQPKMKKMSGGWLEKAAQAFG